MNVRPAQINTIASGVRLVRGRECVVQAVSDVEAEQRSPVANQA